MSISRLYTSIEKFESAVKHLQGRHNQMTHGRGRGGAAGSGDSSGEFKSIAAAMDWSNDKTDDYKNTEQGRTAEKAFGRWTDDEDASKLSKVGARLVKSGKIPKSADEKDASTVINVIADSPVRKETIYRGIGRSRDAKIISSLDEGGEFQIAGPKSFTMDQRVANAYATTTKKNGVILQVEGGYKGAHNTYGDGMESEIVSGGKFKITGKSKKMVWDDENEEEREVTVVKVKQTGVFFVGDFK